MRPFTKSDKIFVAGRLADHPASDAFVGAVIDVLDRYVRDVVVAFGLCPFVVPDGQALGTVIVFVDREPSAEEIAGSLQASGAQVVHVVTPLLALPSNRFERFAGEVAESYRRSSRRAPGEPTLVHASFHPDMIGGEENAHRMVGLVRRAPDPFIQFVPSGIQDGGTVFGVLADVVPVPAQSTEGHGERTYERIRPRLAELAGDLAAMRAERDRAYAPLLAALDA